MVQFLIHTILDHSQGLRMGRVTFTETEISGPRLWVRGVRYPTDSIQYLNLVRKLSFQFKEKSADSIKKIMQFNIMGVIDTGQWEK